MHLHALPVPVPRERPPVVTGFFGLVDLHRGNLVLDRRHDGVGCRERSHLLPAAQRPAEETGMTQRQPPRIATWLLQRMGIAGQNPALAGDLLEEFQNGRSAVWYWRQILWAIAMGM